MLEYFEDWKKKTVKFELRVETTNSVGQTVTTWTDLGTVTVNFWTESSRETDVNDKFVDKKTGIALLDFKEGITPTTTMRMYVSADEIYQVSGVDDVGELGEFYVLSWINDL